MQPQVGETTAANVQPCPLWSLSPSTAHGIRTQVEVQDVHLPPGSELRAAEANAIGFHAFPAVPTAQPLPQPDAFGESVAFPQQPRTANSLSSLADLTNLDFTRGPEVPAPRLAALPASLGRLGTAVSARHLRAWRACSSLASLPRTRSAPAAVGLSFPAPFGLET
ncbi:uncharacterized protein LOC120246955 isoform X2 [Hyaena hyaena]|uniref:uncharacterized protein LOC120246955 isoform X2 n=1 Tax=Hyaena hyaena TaxID=95912 RepID=UPI001921B9C6|nr:uncharacterized protein LOC120246955 isoform X2 [Hyaena hyaena]